MAMILKIDLDGDVRRLRVTFPENADIATKWELLQHEIRQGFQLLECSALVLKYRDADGDLCTLAQHTLMDCLTQVPAGGPLRLIARTETPSPAGPSAPEMLPGHDPLHMLCGLKKFIRAAKGKGKGKGKGACGWRKRCWEQEAQMDTSEGEAAADAVDESSSIAEDLGRAIKGWMAMKGKGEFGKGCCEEWWQEAEAETGKEEPEDAEMPPAEASEEGTPALSPCAGGCGFARTWHATHCCGACAQGKESHGMLCSQIPAGDARHEAEAKQEPKAETAAAATEAPASSGADIDAQWEQPNPLLMLWRAMKGKGKGKGKWGKGKFGKGRGGFEPQPAASTTEMQEDMVADSENMAATHAQHGQNVAQAQSAGAPFDWQQHMQQLAQHMQPWLQHMQQHQADWVAAQSQAASQSSAQWAPSAPPPEEK